MRLYHFSEWGRRKRTIKLGEWETDEVLFKEEISQVKEGWTVLDVGSEFGYYAIKAALLTGNEGKVLAIEPHPRTHQILKMNIRLHQLDNIVPVRKAAGREEGKTELYERIDPGGTSIVSSQTLLNLDRNRINWWLNFIRTGTIFRAISRRYAPVKFVVPVSTLDRIAKDHDVGKIDLIKIDVEGAELDVLYGSLDMLSRDKPALLVEVHYGCSWKPESLYGLLSELGYSLTIEKRNIKALVAAHAIRD